MTESESGTVHWDFVQDELGGCESSDENSEGEPQIKEITSAGILPYAVYKKRVFFLLGKEAYEPKYGDSDRWSDFSGRLDEKDGKLEPILEGACREFYEETAGCVLPYLEAKQRLENGQYLLQSDLHPRKARSIRTYFMLVPYLDYPTMFRNTKQFLQYPPVKGDIKCIEKSQLEWFSFNDVRDIVFHQWGENRYKRKPKFRATFAEQMRRIMGCTDLRAQCIASYPMQTTGSVSLRHVPRPHKKV